MESTTKGLGKGAHQTKPKILCEVDSGLNPRVGKLVPVTLPKAASRTKVVLLLLKPQRVCVWALNRVSWLCPWSHLAKCRVPVVFVECHPSNGSNAKNSYL